jgi:photosystem II stability/assembly factor-like uncharacterized protein
MNSDWGSFVYGIWFTEVAGPSIAGSSGKAPTWLYAPKRPAGIVDSCARLFDPALLRRCRVRRSPILLATSLFLAALMMAAGSGSTAFGAAAPRPGRPAALPVGFKAQSLSWLSPDQGWILGSAPCGQTTCATVIETTDGGATWKTLGTLGAPLTLQKPTGVTEVRFADALHGWAFLPSLWQTTDGGETWTRQGPPGGGHQVLALAGDPEGVYAVVSPCLLGHICSQPVTLWRTMPGQGSWTQVPIELRVTTSPIFLAVTGVVAYVGIAACLVCPPEPDILDATVDGTNWSSRPDPCVPDDLEVLSGIAPVTGTRVALLCLGDPGFGQAEKRVLRSKDSGQTTQPAGRTPYEGITSQISAAPDGALVVSSFGVLSFIYLNTGGRTWTTPVTYNDAGQGWNDIAFTSNEVGFIIHAPVFCCGGHGTGELWETTDGGVTWAPV